MWLRVYARTLAHTSIIHINKFVVGLHNMIENARETKERKKDKSPIRIPVSFSCLCFVWYFIAISCTTRSICLSLFQFIILYVCLKQKEQQIQQQFTLSNCKKRTITTMTPSPNQIQSWWGECHAFTIQYNTIYVVYYSIDEWKLCVVWKYFLVPNSLILSLLLTYSGTCVLIVCTLFSKNTLGFIFIP